MSENAVTIIKRKKKAGGHGHHGGAWKVAYADFVTAMMAFFLLLWLLSSASDDTKKGIADYFDQRIPILQTSGGGESAFRGDSLIAKQDLAHSGREPTVAPTAPRDAAAVKPGDAAGRGAGDAETRALREIETAFKALSGESEAASQLLSHIRTRLTPEGLVIELFDRDGEPLFDAGGARPTPMMEALISVVASVARLVTNDIAVTGHTGAAASPPGREEDNWPLSSDRAHAARRLLGASGLPEGRVTSVAGRAATQPIAEDPADPRNGRVEITLLRRNPLN